MSCQPGRKHKTAPKENKIKLKNEYFIHIFILRLLKTEHECVCHLALRVYQCARLRQLLNLDLEHSPPCLPKITQDNYTGLGNHCFDLKKRQI